MNLIHLAGSLDTAIVLYVHIRSVRCIVLILYNSLLKQSYIHVYLV